MEGNPLPATHESVLQGSVEHCDHGRRDPAPCLVPERDPNRASGVVTREALTTILDTTLASISDFAADRPLANEIQL